MHDVRASKRLKDSAVCLVADDHGMDLRLERFLKQHSQLDKLSKRVLEINGQHELTRRMAAMAVDEASGIQFDELARAAARPGAHRRGRADPRPGRLLAADVRVPGEGPRGVGWQRCTLPSRPR